MTLGWVVSAVMTPLSGEGGSLLVLEFSCLLHWSFPPGEGCGREREEDYTRRQKELGSDEVRTPAAPQDSAAQT